MAPPDSPLEPSPGEAEAHPRQRWWLHGVLFLATCGTTFFAGAVFFAAPDGALALDAGAVFACSIMGILLVHEMGHFLAARAHAVPASLPYFIPVPIPPIGTFGAVIKMQRPPRTANALLDIGCAGPLAGLVVAVVVCFVGLRLSEVKTLAGLPPQTIWQEGNSLLYLGLKALAQPDMGAGQDVWVHPMAWAGWLGLLVTSLNLLPAGQLDGGHVLYALFGARVHRLVARFVHVAVFVLGLTGLTCQLVLLHGPTLHWLREAGLSHLVVRGTGMLVWLLWAVLLKVVGGPHPPVEDGAAPLGGGRRALGILTLVVLALTWTPVIGSALEP